MEKKYYLIEAQYVGPNRKDSHGNYRPKGTLFVQTSPGVRNMSREPATGGWLGTTNDVAEYAHGEYETLDAAQAAAAKLGYTEVEECTDDPDVVEARVSLVDSRQQWDAADWCGGSTSREQQIVEFGITATTTDAELDAIEETMISDARCDGVEVHGLAEHLAELRTMAREANE